MGPHISRRPFQDLKLKLIYLAYFQLQILPKYSHKFTIIILYNIIHNYRSYLGSMLFQDQIPKCSYIAY